MHGVWRGQTSGSGPLISPCAPWYACLPTPPPNKKINKNEKQKEILAIREPSLDGADGTVNRESPWLARGWRMPESERGAEGVFKSVEKVSHNGS